MTAWPIAYAARCCSQTATSKMFDRDDTRKHDPVLLLTSREVRNECEATRKFRPSGNTL